MNGADRFPIRFTGANLAMVVLGITRRNSYVEVAAQSVEVHLGWWFRAVFARDAVRSVAGDRAPVRGWGAHGWNGVWLVNGSSGGIVRIELDVPGRARVAGFAVSLRVVRVSVEDPEGLEAALSRTD